VIPFIKKVTDKFKNISVGLKAKLAFFSLNKLGRIITAQKDTLPSKCNKNVVYKLSCKDCDATYRVIEKYRTPLISSVRMHFGENVQ